ncbi:hypothetical protein RB7568 [Rhodopirellula baltica SH 1]|uniref:Uncharacterized protein n=1 Tax=Rhodopirellula baltica (strain DSM 10527 / NCIMB 13988 / SH1) TaxID=243090 RepID=Q7UNI1_RHOBA|nr:hypothetical protein RB7568 [Rhodopirellula baltica SH 1]
MTRWKVDSLNLASDDWRDPAAHRFDFRQLRHMDSFGWSAIGLFFVPLPVRMSSVTMRGKFEFHAKLHGHVSS